jgi:hypothetical protein
MRIQRSQNGENSGLKRAWNYIWNKGTVVDQEDHKKMILVSIQALGYPARENKKH